MLMLRALKNRSIALLWGGQAMSAIGDEIYRVALIWMAVGLIGADTGYLAAGQSAALLLLTLIGGKWADHWDHFKTMMGVDVLRGLVVLVPVVWVHFAPLSMGVLWPVAITLAGLSAFFEPSVQALLPKFSPNHETIKAANGLMSTTLRIARVAGPGIIGILVVFIPTVHFFSLDALTFAISAASIAVLQVRHRKQLLQGGMTPSQPSRLREGFRESLVSGLRAIRGNRQMSYVMISKGFTGGAWSLAYGLGLVLLAHRIAPGDVRAFGSLIGAYGVGNLSSAFVLGNMRRKRSGLILYSGYTWMGIGFILIGLAPTLPWMMVASAFTAFGGPMNDLPFVDIIQAEFHLNEVPKIYRLRMAIETAAGLATLFMSPFLFREFPIQSVIIACGAVTLISGVIGLARFSEPSLKREQDEMKILA